MPYQCKTQEQVEAVQAILKVVYGHRKRPLVITADRGRGKSSSLAIACAQLLLQPSDNPINIIITSSHSSALSVFFNQLKHSVGGGKLNGHHFSYLKASVEFKPVDELISSDQTKINAGLVIVDEAAAIPVYLLKQLLQHNHRMVFSSTVHGYEGAGRGFAIKFREILDEVCPKWQAFQINEPIRWRQHDPLEQLVFDSCLLNAQLPVLTFKSDEQPFFRILSSSELAIDEPLLCEVYAILVTAHYQTKPNDIKMLLDSEQLECFCMFSSNDPQADVLGVALVMKEGAGQGAQSTEQSEDINVQQVKDSKRRLKSHFIPQSLLVHSGVNEAFDYSYYRIMRIAIHPQVQSKGVGSDLITKITMHATDKNIDFIGSSFAANANLLSFWLKNNFKITRIGFKRDQSSGEHSALVLQALNQKSQPLLLQCHHQFYQQFEYLLVDEYKHLKVDLITLVLASFPKTCTSLITSQVLNDVNDFSNGKRQFSPCVFSLHLWLKSQLVNYGLAQGSSQYSTHALMMLTAKVDLLVSRVMQKHSVADLCHQHNLTGKKAFEEALKKQVTALLEV